MEEGNFVYQFDDGKKVFKTALHLNKRGWDENGCLKVSKLRINTRFITPVTPNLSFAFVKRTFFVPQFFFFKMLRRKNE